jgi:hypothetical protein
VLVLNGSERFGIFLVVNNNAYNLYLAAHSGGFFYLKNMKISSLIEQRGEVNHIFPKKILDE